MSLEHLAEQLKGLPPITQVVLVILTLVVVVLLVVYPTAGTSIITFLMALKMLVTRQK